MEDERGQRGWPSQGVNWEIATSVSMLQAGADLLLMRHPEAAMGMIISI